MKNILTLLLIVSVAAGALTPEISRKLWWAIKINDDLYTGGRLTERQIKYAHEAGFKTMVGMVPYSSGDNYTGHDDVWLSTARTQVVAKTADLTYHTLLKSGEPWVRKYTSDRFMKIYEAAEKPVMLHCTTTFSATFTALLSMARLSKKYTDQPKITIKDIFARLAAQGLDYRLNPAILNLAINVTGETIDAKDVPVPDGEIVDFVSYWLMKKVYRNWYVAGQIHDNHLKRIKNTKIATVVNFRKGLTTQPKSEPSQEQVTLLNVNSFTDTYNGDPFKEIPFRQTKRELERSRLDQSKPWLYVGRNATINYATMNQLEFGDHIGYNEQLEKRAVENSGLKYIHMPIGGQYKYDMKMWDAYGDDILAAGKDGTRVLMHCRTGKRALLATLLAAGKQYKKSRDWALQRAEELNYQLNEDSIKLIQDVLPSSAQKPLVSFCAIAFVVVALLA